MVDERPATMKTRRTPRWPIMRGELDKIIEWIKVHDVEYPAKQVNLIGLCVLLYVTGCRINEVLSLDGKQIQQLVSGAEMRVFISKTNNSRVLFLPDAYQALVRELAPGLRKDVAELGFVNTEGNKLTYRLVEKWMRPSLGRLHDEAVSQNRLPQSRVVGRLLGTHSFRVGCINRMLNHFSLPEVANLVGHSNYATTLT